MIKIDFEFTTKYGVFRDAIHLPTNHTYSEQEIEDMKQQRLSNWINIVENPPVLEESQPPTPSQSIVINGEEYLLLEGTPQSGSKLVEVNGFWYYRIQ